MERQRRSALGVQYAGGLPTESTPFAGVGLLAELLRQAGITAAAERVLPAKRSERGLSHGQMVEVFIMLSALGGECPDDLAVLRQDRGLHTLLGYQTPAPETGRQWLDRFHDEKLLAGRPVQGSFVPRESAGLVALGNVNLRAIAAFVAAANPGREVTLDVDAHVVETAKANARVCYEGYRAFQPLLVQWAETFMVMADEFRDGNVPASRGIRELVDQAAAALPPRADGWVIRVRSDSAAYEPEGILDHWHEQGWEFAVSADLSPQLRAAIEALPEDAWHLWKEERGGMVREWAEVDYVPSRKVERKDAPVYRYVAIRVRRQQGALPLECGEGGEGDEGVRHYAVVSNRWDLEGQALLEWQRGKAGTIEHAHHNLVNELGAGVYPSSKHGANAAWLRLQVLTHNVLQLLKAVALPPEYRQARPKRLRFAVFSHIGQVVRHAGAVLLRVATRLWEEVVGPGQRRLLAAAWPGP